MNIFLLVIFSLFIGSVQSDLNFTIIHQNPMTNIFLTTRQLSLEINQTVNQPGFSSFISFFNVTNSILINRIDVHLNTSNVTYSNHTLTFPIPGFNLNDEFYMTFDAGVLFSSSSANSTAITDPTFWRLKVIAVETTTSVTITSENPSTGTTYSGTTGSSMVYRDTSAFTVSTNTITYTSMSQTTQNSNIITTDTSPEKMITGEPPPTRSAQIGMGLGITFITIFIVVEIIYFKYCYSGHGRSGSYFT